MQSRKMCVYHGFTNALLAAEARSVLETCEPSCWLGRYFLVFDNIQLPKLTAATNQ